MGVYSMTSIVELLQRSAYSHVVRTKSRYARYPKERECRPDLLDQDVGRPPHPTLAAGHQPVEVSASYQASPCPQRHSGDDVAARHDASIDVDLGPVAYRLHHGGQRLQRGGCPIELSSSVVGHNDSIRSGIDDGPGIGRVQDALDDKWPAPDGAEPGEVGDRRGRVEQAPGELGDGALEAPERCKLKRLGSEKVEPPRGVQCALGEGLQREGWRDRQAVADVAQPWPSDWRVDGEHERLVASGLGPGNKVAARLAVAPQIELEPSPSVRRSGS